MLMVAQAFGPILTPYRNSNQFVTKAGSIDAGFCGVCQLNRVFLE
jgi:hypothetical protein